MSRVKWCGGHRENVFFALGSVGYGVDDCAPWFIQVEQGGGDQVFTGPWLTHAQAVVLRATPTKALLQLVDGQLQRL